MKGFFKDSNRFLPAFVSIVMLAILYCTQARAQVSVEGYATPPQDSSVINGNFLLVKNNLVLDGALIMNAGIEYGFDEHFSLAVPITFSPYTVNAWNWRLRTLSFQPELRYWPGNNRSGHFFGLHAHAAYYNISSIGDEYVRYQDRDGKHPLFGAGISYGYVLPFVKDGKWAVELTIGGGYARLDYDMFHNTKNGILFDRGTGNYWGITNLGVNITYRFHEWSGRASK